MNARSRTLPVAEPRRDASVTCAEHLQEQLRMLVAQRQALREREASRNELESNRLEIACRQRQLSQALIDLHLPHAEGKAA
jgi:hypothetical protein